MLHTAIPRTFHLRVAAFGTLQGLHQGQPVSMTPPLQCDAISFLGFKIEHMAYHISDAGSPSESAPLYMSLRTAFRFLLRTLLSATHGTTTPPAVSSERVYTDKTFPIGLGSFQKQLKATVCLHCSPLPAVCPLEGNRTYVTPLHTIQTYFIFPSGPVRLSVKFSISEKPGVQKPVFIKGNSEFSELRTAKQSVDWVVNET